MTDYKIPNDQFDAWWPNLCVISAAGCPVPVMVSSAKTANQAIKRVMESNNGNT